MRRKPGKPVKKGQTVRQVEIPADAVRLGMHVVALDRPWDGVPILFQQFVVESTEQLAILRRYCLGVTVEVSEAQYRLAIADQERFEAQRSGTFPEEKTLTQELPNARQRYGEARVFIEQLLQDVESGQPFALGNAHAVIQNCVASIMANANAMFWLSRIRHQDAYTAEHCLRVAILAISFGRFLDMPPEDLEILGLCGALHDLGKMRIPGNTLSKPGLLTREEMNVMQTHAQQGYDLLGSHHQLAPLVRDTTLSHHERMDGRGYPNGLHRDQISRFTRIVGIVDTYDAITSDRCYKRGLPPAEAIGIIYRASGSHFDESLVEVFIRMIGLYPPGSLVELTSGDIAIVLSTDPNQKLRPVVELILDHKGDRCPPRVLNLAAGPADDTGVALAIARALPMVFTGLSLRTISSARRV